MSLQYSLWEPQVVTRGKVALSQLPLGHTENNRSGVFSSPLAIVVTLGLHSLHGGPWFSRICTIFLQDHYIATAAVGC